MKNSEKKPKEKLGQDDSQGQQQCYGNKQNQGDYERNENKGDYDKDENQGDYEKDVNDTFINMDENADEPVIFIEEDQEEVNIPHKERNTTPPYAGSNSEKKQGFDPTCVTHKDENCDDKKEGCC